MRTSKAAVLALLLLPGAGQGDPLEALRREEVRRFAAMVRADTAALRPMLDEGLSYRVVGETAIGTGVVSAPRGNGACRLLAWQSTRVP